MTKTTILLAAAASVCAATSTFAASLYLEEFDGNTNGYNANSTTAMLGDNDWVDFANRITSDAYTTASGGTETVLAGTSNSNDPQIRSDFGFGIPKENVESIVLRIRIDKDGANGFDDTLGNGDFSVLWGTDSYVSPGAQNGNSQLNFNLGNPSTLAAQSDGWHLATWTIPVGGLTAGTGTDIDSMRIDPNNNATGVSWELDSLTISGVPEPGSALLVSLGAIAAGLRRRRN